MAKILVAEDNKVTRNNLGQFLRGTGYEVELAKDGAEAISLVNENKFDLVISDIVMPRANGWNLLTHVNCVSPDTPVLLMTAYNQVQSSEAYSAASSELILKPFVLTDFLSKVEQILDRRKV